MQVNENVIKGKWKKIKGDIQSAWGKLTDDELEKTKGDLKAISGLIQQRYGAIQEKESEKLEKMLDQLEEAKDSTINDFKKKI